MKKKTAGLITYKAHTFAATLATIFTKMLSMTATDGAWYVITYILYMAAMFYFIIATVFYGVKEKNKVFIVDEMAKAHEAKGANIAFIAATLILFIGMMISSMSRSELTVSFDELFLILFTMMAVKDGVFLLLEKGVFTGADSENED